MCYKYMEGPNRPISEAHPYLRECTVRISEFSNSIRELLDTVVVASEWANKRDILTAWNNWTDHLDLPSQAVKESADRALDFKDSPDYAVLPQGDQDRYWNYLVRANNRFQILSERLKLYSLLSQIEHTEQTIEFLWTTYRSGKAYLLILSNSREVQKREEKKCINRLVKLRGRIDIEMCNLMNLLEEVIVHPAFDSMDAERRELYHAKWRIYLKQIQQFSNY